MNNIYDDMLHLLAENKAVIVATELAPQCGKKYLCANGFEQPDLAGIDLEYFPQTVTRGGKTFFVEQLSGTPELILAGAGHVSLEVAKIAKMLDFTVSVIDDRPEFANDARFPAADRIFCQDVAAGLARPFGANAYYVIVTRGHKDDLRALGTILQKPQRRYVGMIGSKTKVALAMRDLREQGYAENVLSEVHAPIGLRIGAITPAEIAVSIMAEVILVLNKSGHDKYQTDILKELAADREPATLVTVIAKQGSAPRGVGSKMLVSPSGRITGTIGGGAIEYRAAKRAAELAGSGGAEVSEFDLSPSDASELGMVCGGRVSVLLESTGR